MRCVIYKVYKVYNEDNISVEGYRVVDVLGKIYKGISLYGYIQGLPWHSVGRGALFYGSGAYYARD